MDPDFEENLNRIVGMSPEDFDAFVNTYLTRFEEHERVPLYQRRPRTAQERAPGVIPVERLYYRDRHTVHTSTDSNDEIAGPSTSTASTSTTPYPDEISTATAEVSTNTDENREAENYARCIKMIEALLDGNEEEDRLNIKIDEECSRLERLLDDTPPAKPSPIIPATLGSNIRPRPLQSIQTTRTSQLGRPRIPTEPRPIIPAHILTPLSGSFRSREQDSVSLDNLLVGITTDTVNAAEEELMEIDNIPMELPVAPTIFPRSSNFFPSSSLPLDYHPLAAGDFAEPLRYIQPYLPRTTGRHNLPMQRSPIEIPLNHPIYGMFAGGSQIITPYPSTSAGSNFRPGQYTMGSNRSLAAMLPPETVNSEIPWRRNVQPCILYIVDNFLQSEEYKKDPTSLNRLFDNIPYTPSRSSEPWRHNQAYSFPNQQAPIGSNRPVAAATVGPWYGVQPIGVNRFPASVHLQRNFQPSTSAISATNIRSTPLQPTESSGYGVSARRPSFTFESSSRNTDLVPYAPQGASRAAPTYRQVLQQRPSLHPRVINGTQRPGHPSLYRHSQFVPNYSVPHEYGPQYSGQYAYRAQPFSYFTPRAQYSSCFYRQPNPNAPQNHNAFGRTISQPPRTMYPTRHFHASSTQTSQVPTTSRATLTYSNVVASPSAESSSSGGGGSAGISSPIQTTVIVNSQQKKQEAKKKKKKGSGPK